ncbi:MAG: polyisoprenoid-binding protein YceI [Salibacteraceae bacterium]|jgi:polyisoprenoid-binding protein YceI
MKGIKIFTSLAALLFAMSISMHIMAQLPNMGSTKNGDAEKVAIDKMIIDTKASSVNWKAEKVTGEHVGTINIKSGELVIQGGTLNGGNIVINMTSIICNDIDDAGTNAKLIGHLKSEDFFSVEKNETATFVISNVKVLSAKKVMITGNMTIKGISNEQSFEANTGLVGGKMNISGAMKIDRTKYKVVYGSGSVFDDLGDKMIYDEFTLDFKLMTS